MNLQEIIQADNKELDAPVVFKGTVVPVQALFDYLEVGISLHGFLEDYPTVSKSQVVSVLEMANKLVTYKNIQTIAAHSIY